MPMRCLLKDRVATFLKKVLHLQKNEAMKTEIEKIPLVIPVFNQLTYTRNLINWFHFYYPNNPIYIVDNGSTYEPLIENYKHGTFEFMAKVGVFRYRENNFHANMDAFIKGYIHANYGYYIISDPDIMPHPSTPGNFLETFKDLITVGYHRAGFGLITEGITVHNKAHILSNENELKNNSSEVYAIVNGKTVVGRKSPIDTTFCLYSVANGGWSSPMNGIDWGNCVRIFEAFHLPWHLDEGNLNEEMKYYFEHCNKFIPGQPSAGANNYRPKQYEI